MKRFLFCILVLLGLKIFPCECSWEFSEFTPLHLVNYDNIFTGKVIRIDTINRYQLLVTVLSHKTYWGINKDTVKVKTGTELSNCGYAFQLHKEYLIYLKSNALNTIDRCGPTRPLTLEYSDTINYSLPSFHYTKINGKVDRYSEQDKFEFLKKAWVNEVTYLDSISKIENGELRTKFVNGQISGYIKIKNRALTDTNLFYYHNNILKAKGTFTNNKAQGTWKEFHFAVLRKTKTEKTNPLLYYLDSGQMINGERKGLWEKKFIRGDKARYNQIIKYAGSTTNYN